MKDTYESPLASRYASREMLYIFLPIKIHHLAPAVDCPGPGGEGTGPAHHPGQIDELEREKDHINYDLAQEKERELRHDVMATSTPTAPSAPVPCPSSTWGPPAATWGTTRISF